MDYAFFLHKCGHDRSAPVAEEVVQPSSNASDGTEVESDFSHDDVPPWARKLYKKIAMETHPDRALGTDDIEAKETLFRQAAEAIDTSNFETLISLARKLGIPLELEDDKLIPTFEKMIANYVQKLDVLTNSLAWMWCESFGCPNIKLGLLHQALSHDHFSLPSNELLVEWIKTRESVD
jgi:hypothetical protein